MSVLIVVLSVITVTVPLNKAQKIAGDRVIFVEKTEADAATSIHSNTSYTHNEAPYKKIYNKSYKEQLLNNTKNGRLSYTHAVEQDLLHQNWEEQEQPCYHQLLKIVRNVQNSTLWATWIWDSMQFPVGQLYGSRIHLGNYDQCISLPWENRPELRMQYCIAEIRLSELEPRVTDVDLYGPVRRYIQYKTKHGLTYNDVVWGVCAPAICNGGSISKFADAIFKTTNLGQLNTRYKITVNSEHCHVAGEFQEKGPLENIFVSIVICFVFITFLCTWYVGSKGAESKSNSYFAKAFNINSNIQWLMHAEDKSIRSLWGIRMISCFLVTGGHLWLIKNVVGVGNAGDIDKKLDDPIQCAMFNIDVIVDIFFMISGLLLTKSFMEKATNNFNPLVFIIKRYVRLTCSLLLILVMLPIVLLRGNSGPLVKKVLYPEIDAWATSWWRTFLMIGNYGDTANISYAILWSLACDFQLFVIGTLICWIYNKSRKAGYEVYAICAAASLVLPVIYGYMYGTKAVTSFNFIESINYRKYILGDPAYVWTHLRAGPYFVGLAIGYLMALFRPDKYRNVMSKKYSVFAFLAFLLMFLSLLYVSGMYYERQYGPLEGALFSVMKRNGFAALFGFLIIICEYGSLPYISSALGWSGLVPFSRLSYGVYMTHFMLTLRFVSTTRAPLRSDALDDIYSTFGMMATAFSISFLMWLFWEAPTVNLFDMVVKRVVEKKHQNGKVEINERRNGKLTAPVEYTDNNIKYKLH